MAQNIYSLQLLRNGSIFANYEAAVNAITGSSVQDGVIKLARYNGASVDSGNTKYSTGVVKTVFGIYAAMEGNSGWTVFDSYHEVIVELQRQIDAMGGDSGSIAEQIQAAINALNYDSYETGDSKVVVNVTETDGVVAATGQNIANIKLADYTKGEDAGKVAATDTLGEALSKLEKQVEVVSANTADVISGLDYSDSAVKGEYVSQVTETDGVIAVTRVELPTVAPISEAGKPIVAVSETKGAVSATAGTINAEFVNVTGNTFSSSTVQATLAEIVDKYTAADQALKTEILGGASESADTLGELEALINNLEAGAATYTIRKDTKSLPAEIKERYTLVETKNGTPTDKQVTIDIPKDSHIVSINYISDSADTHYQNLEYVYIDDSGNTQTAYVDMAHLILESEFASGVTSTNGVAHGVVDPTSEKDGNDNPFLTVGENGFKVDGIKNAIAAASGDVKTKLDELSGKTVTGVEMTGGTANIADGDNGTKKITINTDGSQIKATGYEKGAAPAAANSAITATDTINAALAKLEHQVDAAKAAATTKVKKDDAASHITLSSSTAADGSVTYTIGESDIASKSDLGAEIAARKAVDGVNGDTYTVDTNAHYINNANTLYGADQALDTALYTVSGKVDNAQAEIDAIESAVGLSNSGAYVAGDGQYTSAATSVADAIDKLDDAVAANKIIAGDGIEITGAASGTTVAVDLKENITTQGSEWENPLQFDAVGKLYFNALDCGEYN